MLLYEAAVLAVAYVAFRVYTRAFRLNTRTMPGFGQLTTVQGAVAIGALLVAVAALAIMMIRNADTVQVCKNNEQTIAAALTSWESVTQTAFTAGTVQVKAGTGGTFSNPNAAAIDYLASQPIDPINPTGSYTLTYVAPTATSPESYTITCPGPHTQADLASIQGGASATKGQIVLTNGQFTAI